ncbi:MAG: hypothetical protein Q7S00_02550 [bacterium]|nr:hypothetical protein [bacterium]
MALKLETGGLDLDLGGAGGAYSDNTWLGRGAIGLSTRLPGVRLHFAGEFSRTSTDAPSTKYNFNAPEMSDLSLSTLAVNHVGQDYADTEDPYFDPKQSTLTTQDTGRTSVAAMLAVVVDGYQLFNDVPFFQGLEAGFALRVGYVEAGREERYHLAGSVSSEQMIADQIDETTGCPEGRSGCPAGVQDRPAVDLGPTEKNFPVESTRSGLFGAFSVLAQLNLVTAFFGGKVPPVDVSFRYEHVWTGHNLSDPRDSQWGESNIYWGLFTVHLFDAGAQSSGPTDPGTYNLDI